MNLRAIANTATRRINPNITVSIQRSTGYTVGVGMRQVPSYAAAVSGLAQLQPLSAQDVQHVAGLNIQSEMRVLILTGELNGVMRGESKGGDLVTIGSQVWLVVTIFERWPDWMKVGIALQT